MSTQKTRVGGRSRRTTLPSSPAPCSHMTKQTPKGTSRHLHPCPTSHSFVHASRGRTATYLLLSLQYAKTPTHTPELYTCGAPHRTRPALPCTGRLTASDSGGALGPLQQAANHASAMRTRAHGCCCCCCCCCCCFNTQGGRVADICGNQRRAGLGVFSAGLSICTWRAWEQRMRVRPHASRRRGWWRN